MQYIVNYLVQRRRTAFLLNTILFKFDSTKLSINKFYASLNQQLKFSDVIYWSYLPHRLYCVLKSFWIWPTWSNFLKSFYKKFVKLFSCQTFFQTNRFSCNKKNNIWFIDSCNWKWYEGQPILPKYIGFQLIWLAWNYNVIQISRM